MPMYSILFLVKTWHILALMESVYEEFSEGISDPPNRATKAFTEIDSHV